jgi:hypothetical protein
MKYSSSVYPTLARLNAVLMMNGDPGPVMGPWTLGTGTLELGRVGGEGPVAPAVTDESAIVAMTTAAATAATHLQLDTVPHPLGSPRHDGS